MPTSKSTSTLACPERRTARPMRKVPAEVEAAQPKASVVQVQAVCGSKGRHCCGGREQDHESQGGAGCRGRHAQLYSSMEKGPAERYMSLMYIWQVGTPISVATHHTISSQESSM